ncbi:hypothetical protein ACLIMP_04375 [Novosphingobium aerophilum]|uniref:hypothetical protein n=1 Tax=Novosphingobium aerophilum TaxID=2839843 RepID=UPI003FCFFA27
MVNSFEPKLGFHWTREQQRIIRKVAIKSVLSDLAMHLFQGLAIVTFPIWYLPACLIVGVLAMGRWSGLIKEIRDSMNTDRLVRMFRLAVRPDRLPRTNLSRVMQLSEEEGE